MGPELFSPHGLAGLCPADLHHVLARRLRAEVVVVGNHAMHFGSGQVQRFGDAGHRSGRNVTHSLLHSVQDGHERAGQVPYIALNCAAVPGEMFEAELFGAERGAYTGADKKRPGLVSAAQGGTLFLDEIAEVPMVSQAKLLRFLEGREFRPLGGTASETFTGRVVSATNKSLRAEVEAGKVS